MDVDLPLGLITALESGSGVLFLGAGVGYNVRNSSGEPAPTAAVLAEKLATRYSIDLDDEPDLAKVAQVIELRRGRESLLGFLKTEMDNLEPDDDIRWLLSLTW